MAARRHMPLSDNHRRAITTTLTLLDQRLCECEQIARGRQIRSVFYQERNDLSAAQRRRLLHEIARAREALREIKDVLSLGSEAESLSRQIRGASSSAWESLIETQSRRLRGYGKVPQALADYLDPSLERLIECSLNIGRIVEGHKHGPAPDAEEGAAHAR